MSAHTPGPWHLGEDYSGIQRVYAGRSEIVRALSTHGLRRIPKAERDANRKLIAAAPQMKAALNALVLNYAQTGRVTDDFVQQVARMMEGLD